MEFPSFNVKSIILDRKFSADGSDILFNHIENKLLEVDKECLFVIIIDFSEIDLVSTSFIGRFQTRIKNFKWKYPSSKIKLINLRTEIKKQFLRDGN